MNKTFFLDKIYFVLEKFILSRTNLILFQTKKYFVQADGQGINFNPAGMHKSKYFNFFFQNGEFIVILPKEGKTLFQIEEQIASSGISVFNILENFMSYK